MNTQDEVKELKKQLAQAIKDGNTLAEMVSEAYSRKKCTKPHCDCLFIAEKKANGPVKDYPCLADQSEFITALKTDKIKEYAKAYVHVPVLSYPDKLFERYVVDARNEFVNKVVKHIPHLPAEVGITTPEGIELRTACEDILIAYDQMREKLAAPVPGKEEVYRELLIEIDKALYIGDDLTDEDILKWYIDVITTIKDEIKETLASTKQSNESVQQVAKEENNGFVYDYEFLFKLTRKTNKLEWGEGLSMEEIEAVLLSLEYPLAGASFNSNKNESKL